MNHWINNNNVLKILSLILALMLWMVVSIDRTSTPNKNSFAETAQNTYFYEAKVSPIFNENQFVVKMITEEINVTLRGNAEVIDQIRNGKNIDKGQFFVNLVDHKAGNYKVPVQYSGFYGDVDVEIEPSLVQVQIEAKQRKEFNIIVDKLGKEEDGYQSGDPIVKPKKVHISGTKDQIEQVAFVKAFINIDQVKEPILQEVPLRALDKDGNEIKVEIIPQTVEVQIPVTSPYVTVPITYKIDKYPAQGYAVQSILQKTKDVTLYGPKDVISNYSVYTGPGLDLSNLYDTKTLEINIPLAAKLLKTEPDTLEFEVTIVKSDMKTISQVPIEVNGLSEGLSANIIQSSAKVDIALEGAPKVLETITKDDLQAFIDVTNLPPGEHKVIIQYNVPLLTKKIGSEERVNVKIIKE